ncbi:unnamed protein product [Arctogadus glacialis]
MYVGVVWRSRPVQNHFELPCSPVCPESWLLHATEPRGLPLIHRPSESLRPPPSMAEHHCVVSSLTPECALGKPSLRRIKGRIHRSKSLDSIDLLDAHVSVAAVEPPLCYNACSRRPAAAGSHTHCGDGGRYRWGRFDFSTAKP